MDLYSSNLCCSRVNCTFILWLLILLDLSLSFCYLLSICPIYSSVLFPSFLSSSKLTEYILILFCLLCRLLSYTFFLSGCIRVYFISIYLSVYGTIYLKVILYYFTYKNLTIVFHFPPPHVYDIVMCFMCYILVIYFTSTYVINPTIYSYYFCLNSQSSFKEV